MKLVLVLVLCTGFATAHRNFFDNVSHNVHNAIQSMSDAVYNAFQWLHHVIRKSWKYFFYRPRPKYYDDPLNDPLTDPSNDALDVNIDGLGKVFRNKSIRNDTIPSLFSGNNMLAEFSERMKNSSDNITNSVYELFPSLKRQLELEKIRTKRSKTNDQINFAARVYFEQDENIKEFLINTAERLHDTIVDSEKLVYVAKQIIALNDTQNEKELVSSLLNDLDDRCRNKIKVDIVSKKAGIMADLGDCVDVQLLELSRSINVASTMYAEVNQAIADESFQMFLIQEILDKNVVVSDNLILVADELRNCQNMGIKKLREALKSVIIKVFQCRGSLVGI